MLSPTFGGVGSRCRTGARALLLTLALAAPLVAAPALSPPPQPTPAPPPAAADAAKADADAILKRLAEEIERIDPSSPDAVSRLRVVVRELIEVNRAGIREATSLRSEVAALRGKRSVRGAASAPHRRARKSGAPPPAAFPRAGTETTPAGTVATAKTTSAAPVGGAPQQVSGQLFGKRGLKKVHRPGCVFGERIRAEDRVFFSSMKEAAAAGYEACKICRPGE